MDQSEKLRTLIISDSSVIRLQIKKLLLKDGNYEVIAAVATPHAARRWMRGRWPHVILMEISEETGDTVRFIREITELHPTPFLLFTTPEMERIAVDIREAGLPVCGYAARPDFNDPHTGEELSRFFSMARGKITDMLIQPLPEGAAFELTDMERKSQFTAIPRYGPDEILPPWDGNPVTARTDRIVVIGASAGGISAIETLLRALPATVPGIVIVQHLPAEFTASFAGRMNELVSFTVREAGDGDPVREGHVYIAPGDRHLVVRREGRGYLLRLLDGPPVSRHRPSVDVLFRSAAREGGKNILGIMLTGMGDDGASEMLAMRRAGSPTIAQDRETSMIFGMPGEAIRRDAAQLVLPLEEIPAAIVRFHREGEI